ncbi:MAG: hypothetical protein VKK62_10075 [Synechococcaceae cyanobacterium]|nr:hypothetical protein [Synechococcaceae cyanobacterium]
MTRSPSPFAAFVRTVDGFMNEVKEALGLPRSITLLGVVRACPILVALVTLSLVALGVILFA